MNIISIIKKNKYIVLALLVPFFYHSTDSKNDGLGDGMSIHPVLDALEILASNNSSTLVKDLHELFDLLKVESPREAIIYVTQMHQDIESLISELGAIDFDQALGNAKQYKSVFEQVLMLKDSIRATTN